jgi:hypothetical protein
MRLRYLVGLLPVVVLISAAVYFKDSLIHRQSPFPRGTQESGVIFYDYLRTQKEHYNIVNEYSNLAECRIMNMEGETVFEFPPSNCLFLKDGSVVLSRGVVFEFFSPRAELLWSIPEGMHHDFTASQDESEIFFLSDKNRDKENVKHFIVGIDLRGKETFRWDADAHRSELQGIFGRELKTRILATGEHEFLHLNSLQLLPPNPWEKSNPAFKRGNILTNCMDGKTAFIIDRASKKILWYHNFSKPHLKNRSATLAEEGVHSVKMLPNGLLHYFSNGKVYSYDPTRFSSIEELNPIEHKLVWRYLANPVYHMYSGIWGSSIRLDNGNVLVTHSMAGSAFEITPQGRLVWEWFNPNKDEFGLASPIFRVTRVPKPYMDKIINVWKKVR